MKRFGLLVLIFCLVISDISIAGMDVTVFSCDFENGIPSEISGGGFIDNTEGYSSYGFGEFFLRSDGSNVTLTLTNLPQHDSIDINFLLAVLDSWDGNTTSGGTIPVDYFNVSVDGVEIFEETFDYSNPSDQSYPITGEACLAYGEGLHRTSDPIDAAYNMGVDPTFSDILHTSDTLTISWWADGSGWQGLPSWEGINDESFAIDNIEITLNNTIPAPGAICLGLLGVSFTGWLKRRKSL